MLECFDKIVPEPLTDDEIIDTRPGETIKRGVKESHTMIKFYCKVILTWQIFWLFS